MRHISIGSLTVFLCLIISNQAFSLSYFITTVGSDDSIYCDLLYIMGNSVKCRQGRGSILYNYDSLLIVKVLNNDKEFIFEKELQTSKNGLAEAFNKLNTQKVEELQELATARDDYYAERGLEPPDSGIYKGTKQKTVANSVTIPADRDRVSSIQDKIQREKRALEQRKRFSIEECLESGEHRQRRAKCAGGVEKSYRNKISQLESDPEYYFEKKRAKLNQHHHQKPKGRHYAKPDDNSTVQPGINSTVRTYKGETLRESGGIYLGNDGSMYNKAAGGVIDSKTGEFIPTH